VPVQPAAASGGPNVWAIFGGVVAVCFIGLVIIGASAPSECRVVSVTNSDDSFLVNGEFDYGVVVRSVVAIEGSGRSVEVNARLETSAGDYRQRKTINISDNGRRTVEFQFIEPTIATVVSRSFVSCS
jgi:hypothetical protein